MSEKMPPSLCMGIYQMINVDRSNDGPVRGFCESCGGYHFYGQPLLEVSQNYVRIAMTCPVCGTSCPLLRAAVQEIKCVQLINPASTSPDF